MGKDAVVLPGAGCDEDAPRSSRVRGLHIPACRAGLGATLLVAGVLSLTLPPAVPLVEITAPLLPAEGADPPAEAIALPAPAPPVAAPSPVEDEVAEQVDMESAAPEPAERPRPRPRREYAVPVVARPAVWPFGADVYRWQPLVEQQLRAASTRQRLDPALTPDLVLAVIACESLGDPLAVSDADAVGLMQVLPSTFADLQGDADPFDPDANVLAGILYLNLALRQEGGDLEWALAAYHAGIGAAARARTGEGDLWDATLDYVDAVMDLRDRALALRGVAPPPPPAPPSPRDWLRPNLTQIVATQVEPTTDSPEADQPAADSDADPAQAQPLEAVGEEAASMTPAQVAGVTVAAATPPANASSAAIAERPPATATRAAAVLPTATAASTQPAPPTISATTPGPTASATRAGVQTRIPPPAGAAPSTGAATGLPPASDGQPAEAAATVAAARGLR